jgi:hypothetical protein
VILFQASPLENNYKTISSVTEFAQHSGIQPIMKNPCSCYSKRDGCLCGIDAEATAKAGNFDLDIGDKYDYHRYAFKFKSSTSNPNWPSKTGNLSGKGRGNNITE